MYTKGENAVIARRFTHIIVVFSNFPSGPTHLNSRPSWAME